jgi:hypothetical protein
VPSPFFSHSHKDQDLRDQIEVHLFTHPAIGLSSVAAVM